MIKALVMSKNRPLQLHGYLSSITSLTSIAQRDITVLLPDMTDYEEVAKNFPEVSWLKESDHGGFDSAYRYYVENLSGDDTLLYGCDDVVFIRPVGLNSIPSILENNPNLIGFSLRLGRNISPRPTMEAVGMVSIWNWTQQPWGHFGYPGELMASLYRASLIKEFVNNTKKQIKTPNYLESEFVTYLINNKGQESPEMSMFNSDSYALAVAVNRVQNDFQNKVMGGSDHDPDLLKEKYKQGYRMDWTLLFGIKPQDCFVGANYFRLVK